MPRKTSASATTGSRPSCGFNEAAARCRGKPGEDMVAWGLWLLASMRPRPDAAENRALVSIAGARGMGLQ